MSTIQTNLSGLIHVFGNASIQRSDPYTSTIQTRRLYWWRKCYCSEEMSRGDVVSDCRFSSETPTRPISKHVAQVWSSWWCKCTCSEERSSLVVDFPHDSLSEHNPGKYVRLCSILFKCYNVSTKSPHNWSLLFTNPYPSNITMFRFVMMYTFCS